MPPDNDPSCCVIFSETFLLASLIAAIIKSSRTSFSS